MGMSQFVRVLDVERRRKKKKWFGSPKAQKAWCASMRGSTIKEGGFISVQIPNV